MQWLAEYVPTWALVAIGGALGSGLSVLLLRTPSPKRRLLGVAAVCGLLGVYSAYPYWPAFAAPITFGVLGSAASMLAISIAPPIWLNERAIRRSTLAVTKRLAVYCAVGVTCALSGYLAVRAGITLYVKLR